MILFDKNLKKEIVYLSLYIIVGQVLIYFINGIISKSMPHIYSGNYFASISVLIFLANICSFGAQFVLTKNVPLLKIKYADSFWHNLREMSIFFIKLFVMVLT